MKLRIQHFRRLNSTNTFVLKQAARGEPEGLVVVTDYQTHGRGKFNNIWVSPPHKDLLFSVLLRPPMKPREAPLLTQIACRSVATVLKKQYGLQPTFKKPNDVIVKGKKICGVLVEATTASKHVLESAVVGIGLNVNSDPSKLVNQAISVKAAIGKSLPRMKLMKHILEQFMNDLLQIYARPA